MAYPSSSTVSSGQPTAASQYNNLRKDALYLGQSYNDSLLLGNFFAKFASGFKLILYSVSRLKLVIDTKNPPTIVINGCLLQMNSNVVTGSGLIAGAAAIYYIFAVQTPGSVGFTMVPSTSASETDNTRLIGECYWDGSTIRDIVCYFPENVIPEPDYDSGYFACTTGTTYAKAHGLLNHPRLVLLFHTTNTTGYDERELVTVVTNAAGVEMSPVGITDTYVYVQTGAAGAGTCVNAIRRQSATGYYRILAWL